MVSSNSNELVELPNIAQRICRKFSAIGLKSVLLHANGINNQVLLQSFHFDDTSEMENFTKFAAFAVTTIH